MSSLKKLDASINRKKGSMRRPKSKLLIDSEMGTTRKQVSEHDRKQMIFQHYMLQLQGFYTRHNPDNLDMDVLVILVEYAVEVGVEKLNKKLTQKYGEDLRAFPGIMAASPHESQIF